MILLNLGDKIKGDSVVKGHDDWITVSSVQFGVGRAVSTSGGGKDRETSNPSISEVSVTKTADRASCDLFAQAAGGKQLGTAKIDFIQQSEGEPQIYMQIELDKPIVTGYTVSSGGERPEETISINFVKVKVHYWQFEDGDKVTEISPRGWDIAVNTKWD